MTLSYRLPLHIPFSIHVRMFADRIKAIVQGDSEQMYLVERRFREILCENDRLIVSICLSFTDNKEDFEDLHQDTLLNMWKGLAQFRGESCPSTWVYRVALNTCISYRRRSRVRKRDVEGLHEFYRELFDESSREELERYEQMYRLISALPQLDKSVLLMWLDDKTYDEIAEVIGVSRDAVASRLKRIKDRLAVMAMFTQELDSRHFPSW